MDSLGLKIIKLRQSKDITQVNLAKQINITKAMLSKYENDINIPKADVLGRIAHALGTTADFLLGLEEALPESLPDDGKVHLHSDEYKLLQLYRTLSAENRIRLQERALSLNERQNEENKNK